MTDINRNVIYNKLDEVKAFETKMGRALREIPLKEVVAVEPELIQQKVMDTVIRGAEHVPLWNKCCKVVQMTAPKFEVPVIAYTDWKSYKGLTGSNLRESGGLFDRIELDCSGQKGLRRVKVGVDKSSIKQFTLDIVEEGLEAAGQVIYDAVLSSIIYEYENDVDSAMTDVMANWGNNHYKSLVYAVSLIAAERMYPDIVLIDPAELYDLLTLDYFVHANYASAAARGRVEPASGLAGYLFPDSIPIYFHPAVTAASMIVAASQKAVVLGVYQDLTVENFDDVIAGEEGGVVSMQWDVKSGYDAKLTKPTKKAWAVVTSA